MPLSSSDIDHDAHGLAALVQRGDIHPLELVDATIAAIESTQSDLNAVITPMFEQARAEARSYEAKDSRGLFGGVPYLLKDIRASYAGVPTSSGSALLRDAVLDYDSEIVIRHKRAGLICVGKTNTPELGLTATTEPHAFGPTKNPWNLERTPGGSSGGAAAAVAAHVVSIAHASDGGGSIRIPAACCGLVGLKPTRGRNPLGPDAGDVMNGLVVEHILSRTVRDSAGILDVTAGPDVGDPYWAPPAERSFTRELFTEPGQLRIALSMDSPLGTPVHEDCVKAVKHTGIMLEDLGHHVEVATPEYDDEVFRKAFTTIWFANLAATINEHPQVVGREVSESDYEPFTWLHYERGKQTSGTDYVRAVTLLQVISRQVAAFFERYDLWLTPTLASPPPPLGFLHPGPRAVDLRPFASRVKEFVPFTQLANATGQPAISLPLHWNDDNLPIGSHLTARFGEESTLLRVAAQLELDKPWKEHRPPYNALS